MFVCLLPVKHVILSNSNHQVTRRNVLKMRRSRDLNHVKVVTYLKFFSFFFIIISDSKIICQACTSVLHFFRYYRDFFFIEYLDSRKFPNLHSGNIFRTPCWWLFANLYTVSSRDDPVPGKESSSALVLELAVLVLSQGNLQHVVKLKQIHSSVFNKFPIQQYYVCRGEQNYSLIILKITAQTVHSLGKWETCRKRYY